MDSPLQLNEYLAVLQEMNLPDTMSNEQLKNIEESLQVKLPPSFISTLLVCPPNRIFREFTSFHELNEIKNELISEDGVFLSKDDFLFEFFAHGQAWSYFKADGTDASIVFTGNENNESPTQSDLTIKQHLHHVIHETFFK